MFYLKKLNLEDKEAEYDFLKQLPSSNGFENKYYSVSKEVFFNKSLQERLDAEQGINLPEGYVPDVYYFLWHNDHIVGLYKIRPTLSDSLKEGAGHIGYAILPSKQKKGYGSKGLELAINELKRIIGEDEKEIYLACHRKNIASLKVQERNGAYIHHMDDTDFYTRIKV